MRKTSFVILLFLLSICGVFAQQSDNNVNDDIKCIDDKYTIDFNQNIKIDTSIDFSVGRKEDIGISQIETTKFSIKNSNGEEIYTTTGKSFSYSFEKPGVYSVQLSIKDSDGCSYELNKRLDVFSDIYLYIGNEEKIDNIFSEKLARNSIFMKEIIMDDKSFFSSDYINSLIADNIYYLINADRIIINSKEFGSILTTIGKFGNIYDLNLSEKSFFFVTSLPENFLRRTLSQYIKEVGINKNFLLNKDNFNSLLVDLAEGENYFKDKQYLRLFNLESGGKGITYSLSFVIDFLLFNGFPISLIGLIFTLSVALLVITIFRQIIGFSVFGVHSPVLFSVSVYVLGLEISLWMLFIAFIATVLVNLFSRKVYLLYSPRLSLLMIVYFLFSLILFWADNFFGLNFIDYSVFADSFIIFPFIFIIIVANKIFSDNMKLFSFGWFFSVGEFLIVSYVVYLLITWSFFEFLMLSYPDLIFLIIFLNILVGRFTGLQLLEYFRFMPLIKRYQEEE